MSEDRIELERRISAGYQRLFTFVWHAIEDRRPARGDWRAAVLDVAKELDRIVQRNAHPDDVMRARTAMSSLAGIWLDPDETDDVYEGKP